MRKFIAILVALLPLAAHAQEDRSWHLLQKQVDGGIASIQHGLTKAECEFAKNRIEGQPATPQEVEDAHKFQDAADARWLAWVAAHGGCDGDGWGSTTGGSRKDPDGMCWRGEDMSGIIQNPRSYGPHDVDEAECFQ